jgi:hypothetical protein
MWFVTRLVPTCRLLLQSSGITDSSTPPQIEVAGSSKILVPIYQSTRGHMPEDHNLESHHCENLKSHFTILIKFMIRNSVFYPEAT